MHIGLTFDLRDDYIREGYSELETAEFDRADTIDAIADALDRLGHDIDRIGSAKSLVGRLASGDRWDMVFNICEGLHGRGREAVVPALLDAYEIPYTFADPYVMAVCLDKHATKALVRDAGLATPRSCVVADVKLVDRVDLRYPLFAKPIAEGTGKGVSPQSFIESVNELREVCRDLLTDFHQPVLVEEYLPGREFTVGILGTGVDARVLGTLEIVLLGDAEPHGYSYNNKENCEELVEYRKASDRDPQVAEAEQLALVAWRTLGCRDAGRIDLRCDASGQPQFIEANPLAGLHPFHSDLPMIATAAGISYDELIGRIVASALARAAVAAGTT